MIDVLDQEVLQWANTLVQAKSLAEQASAAGNHQQMLEYRGLGDQARNRLHGLGFGWVAQALSADGANADQARAYVTNLQRHLAAWAGDARQTPPLSLRDGLDGRIYSVSGAQITTVSGGSWTTLPTQVLGSLGAGLGAGITNAAAPARSEAKNWLSDVVQPAVRLFWPVLILWGAVKIVPAVARSLRGR